MTAQEHADVLRDAVRRHVAGGGEQHLDQLVELAEDADVAYRKGRSDLAFIVRGLADSADALLNDEHQDRQLLLEHLIRDLRKVTS
jgi:hypothetical protein